MTSKLGITKAVTVNTEFSISQLEDIAGTFATVLLMYAQQGVFPKPDTTVSYRAIARAFGPEIETIMNKCLDDVANMERALNQLMAELNVSGEALN